MTPNFVFLESIVRRAPLALRCIDTTTKKVVSDGLIVTAQCIGSREPARVAYRSQGSGIFGFHSLDLHTYEQARNPYDETLDAETLRQSVLGNACGPTPEAADLNKPNFTIMVQDVYGNFLPQVIQLCLPKLAVYEVGLYAAPARPAIPGYGVLRMDLWDISSDKVAAWALVQVDLGGATYLSHADARGVAVVFIDYKLKEIAAEVKLDAFAWKPTITIFYQPDLLDFPLKDLPPTLRSIAAQTRQMNLQVNADPVFKYREGLILKTPGLEQTPNQGRLLITPA